MTPVRVWKLWRSKPSACMIWMPLLCREGESWAEMPHMPNQLLASRSLSLKSMGGTETKSCFGRGRRGVSGENDRVEIGADML